MEVVVGGVVLVQQVFVFFVVVGGFEEEFEMVVVGVVEVDVVVDFVIGDFEDFDVFGQ